MAEKITKRLVDDLDGQKAAETVKFGLDGAFYQIDLSEANAERLRSALADFVVAGRKTGGSKRRSANREEAAQIRDWARQTGKEVSDRGRIPSELATAFREAQKKR